MNYLTAEEVMNITGYKKGKAYNIIRNLNKELKENGYVTFRGKIDKKYFYSRTGIAYVEKVVNQ